MAKQDIGLMYDKVFLTKELQCLIISIIRHQHFAPGQRAECEQVIWDAIAKIGGTSIDKNNFDKAWDSRVKNRESTAKRTKAKRAAAHA